MLSSTHCYPIRFRFCESPHKPTYRYNFGKMYAPFNFHVPFKPTYKYNYDALSWPFVFTVSEKQDMKNRRVCTKSTTRKERERTKQP